MSTAMIDDAETESGVRSTLRMFAGWPAWIVAALVLAAVSLPVMRDSIGYDPYSWAIWGREIAHGHLDTRGSATAVKPLPMFYDAIFAFTGSHLPMVWMYAARVGALLGFAAVFRLARRLAGIPAAVIGVAAYACCHALLGYLFMRGLAEPMAATATVVAVDYFLLRRYRLALTFLVVSAYLRPEGWPLLLIFLIWWTWRMGWWRRLIAVAVGIFVPFSWFLIDYIGASQFKRSANAATQQSQGGPLLHHYPGLATLTETWALASGPVVVAFLIAVVASVVMWWRSGHPLDPTRWSPAFTVALAALAWVFVDAVLAQGRFATGASRYLLPAVALACALCGWVVVSAAHWARDRWLPESGRRACVVPASVVAALAVMLPTLIGIEHAWRGGYDEGKEFAKLEPRLVKAIRLAGGRDAVLRCGGVTTRNFQVSFLAWELDTDVTHIAYVVTGPGVVFQQDRIPRIPAAYRSQFTPLGEFGGDAKLSSWRVLSSC